ncbi:hypothetical protein U1Q18_003955 [Sarracenia purpurea var. burkii]
MVLMAMWGVLWSRCVELLGVLCWFGGMWMEVSARFVVIMTYEQGAISSHAGMVGISSVWYGLVACGYCKELGLKQLAWFVGKEWKLVSRSMAL